MSRRAVGCQETPPADPTDSVRDFYDRIVEYEWVRLDRYVLEFATVRRYLERYLPPPPAKVVDIGAGPGRYAVLLAEQGYDVTALDLSDRNVAWARSELRRAGLSAAISLGDARDLDEFAEGSFDAALLMGPLYHLPVAEDRDRAVAGVRRLLKPGGVAFTMMLTRAAALYEGFNRWPEGILDRDGVDTLMRTGHGFNFERDPHDFEHVYFAHPGEVRPLHESQGLRTVAVAGCEGVLGGRRESFNQLSPDLQAAWVETMLEICEDPSILGAAERLLYVGLADDEPV